jgi:hypothetical protein
LLELILNNIYRWRVRPLDKDRFLRTLREVIREYPTDSYKQPFNPKPELLYILGMYNDMEVIDSLKRDAEVNSNEILNAVKPTYGLKFTANIIDSHKEDLFEFKMKLERENKNEAVIFLEDVRRTAKSEANFLKQNPDPYLHIK